MGLELCNVLSEERHYGDFVCLICQNVVALEALVTAPCSHCFCRTCLEDWIGRITKDENAQFLQYDDGESPNAPRCPTCSHDLLYSHNANGGSKYSSMMIGKHSITVQSLDTCQPLAFRILKKIKVKCPLHSRIGCVWVGDYGDMKEHVLSKTAHAVYDVSHLNSSNGEAPQSGPGENPSRPHGEKDDVDGRERRQLALAQSFKEEGNDQFATGHNLEAKELYTKGLSMIPGSEDDKLKATLYSNRAAVFLKLDEHASCIQDCKAALELDPTYTKVYVRKTQALKQQGKFQEVVEAWSEALQKCKEESREMIEKELAKATRLSSLMQDGQKQLKHGSYGAAKAAFGRALRETTAADAIVGAAKADLGLGQTESAMRLSLQVIKGHPDHVAEGYEVRGACLFLMGDFEGGRKLVIEALRQAPDLVSAQKLRRQCGKVMKQMEEARQHVFHRRFKESVRIFTEVIEDYGSSLPVRSQLYCILYSERSEAYLRLRQYDSALSDCALVLSAREDYKQAWLIRLQALRGLGQHETAKADADKLLNSWGANDTEIRQARNKADFDVRKMKRLDYYKLLGVSPVASELEIKQAYRRMSLDCHPNNISRKDMSASDRKLAEQQYRRLGEGLEILCDDFKRQLYDEGCDQAAIQEWVDKAKRTAKAL